MSVALVGMPNVGKTALFNALTGSFQKVANFPGVTVEKKSATMSLGSETKDLVDLPGLYSMDIATLDEKVSRDWLLKTQTPLIVVLDATHLKKSLYILTQVLELGYRPLIALSQMDQATKRGLLVDVEKFSALTGCQVHAVSAVDHSGIESLKAAIFKLEQPPLADLPIDYQKQIKTPQYVREKFRLIDSWLQQIILSPLKLETLTEQLDRFILHPIWGFFILLAVLLVVFQALFSWSAPLQDLIETGVGLLGESVASLIAQPLLRSLIVDGMIGGVGSIVVFLPQILFLFVFLQMLEDLGYLSRVAFLLDGLMRHLGLPGKAIVPLISGHACAIPAIMATRILDDRRERMISMLVIPITTCSARLPVFTLLVAALVPNIKLGGVVSAQALVMLALYVFPMSTALIVAAILRKVLPFSAPSMLLMEMPPYRKPRLSAIYKTLINQSKTFLSNAGKVILLFSVIIWFLVSFPRTEMNEAPQIENSYAAHIGRAVDPIFRPLGFDWKLNTALIPAFGAREVLVSALGTVYAVKGEEEEQIQGLSQILAQDYSLATLLSLIVWFVFAPQCISTFAILRKESGGYRVPLVMLTYTLVLAWVMSFLTYSMISLL
jgi:ferrous iron transport protein B